MQYEKLINEMHSIDEKKYLKSETRNPSFSNERTQTYNNVNNEGYNILDNCYSYVLSVNECIYEHGKICVNEIYLNSTLFTLVRDFALSLNQSNVSMTNELSSILY